LEETILVPAEVGKSIRSAAGNKMKIIIGSENKIKVEAVKEIIQEYSHLKDAEILSKEANSDVSDQPKSLEETIQGAMNRARNVFLNCDYAIGLESGLMAVPKTKSGFMDVCVCAIYDGNEYHLGLSSAWETPSKVANYMLKDGLNMTDAAIKAGLSKSSSLGSEEGLIGVMTKGRLTRKGYTKEALRTALIHLDI
jgi:inosine/xanthosine triphosphatase